MLQLMPGARSPRSRITRRDMVRISAMGALGAGLSGRLDQVEASTDRPLAGPARHCIYIFLCGGPSQLDIWDPKPLAPSEIRGPIKPIATSVPGIQFGDLIPLTARHADKLSVIRSLHHDSNSHQTGILRTLLASKRETGAAFPPEPSDHPSIGAMLSHLYGAQGTLPPWVVLPRYFTTGNQFYKGQTAGFLGNRYAPLEVGEAKQDSLARTEFNLKNLDLRGNGTSPAELESRRSLLASLEENRDIGSEAPVQQFQSLRDRAHALLTSRQVREVFDVTREPQPLRERYGMNEYGQSFLLARRLVEADVRMINVFWTFYGKDGCQFNLWDNHGGKADTEICGGINKGLDMLRHDYCCPSFDRAFSALLEDLDQRGLLDETLVVVVGEFGRTPKINAHTGRDHWSSCYSAVMAGGGIRGGTVYGQSDKHAAYVADMPVTPYDMHATVLRGFGITPSHSVPGPLGRPVRVTDGNPIEALFS